MLLAGTLLALAWANASAETYTSAWETRASIWVGSWHLDLSLRNWVNDGFMTLFFLLVGLNIKRELLVGELSSFRQAVLPVLAALGGMVMPALLFLAVAGRSDAARGWGIPVATDIAFSLGILALLGDRVPAGLKIFLATLAIADDVGAVLVIALFYAGPLNWGALGVAALLFGLLLISNWLGVRNLVWYGGLGLWLWLAILYSGIHATMAGILLALAVPAWSRLDPFHFHERTGEACNQLRDKEMPNGGVLADEDLLGRVYTLTGACARLQPSSRRLEHLLEPWVAMVVLPIFALANSGVSLSRVGPGLWADPLAVGIALGLLVGKPAGILLATWAVVRLDLASLPRGVSRSHLFGLGLLGGVGFTMALFIADLAVDGGGGTGTARLAILCASTLAGTAGYLVLRLVGPAQIGCGR